MQQGFHRLHTPMLLLLLDQEDLELNEDELFQFISLWLEANPQSAPTAAPQVCVWMVHACCICEAADCAQMPVMALVVLYAG